MRADEFLSKLKGVKSNGNRKWMACCPAHDDSDPSLGIAEARNGNILVKCFAGCSALDITNAVGLRLEDLFIDAYEEPPMAFAQREMAKRDQVKKDIDYIVTWVAVYTAQWKRGFKPTPQEAAKFKHYKEIVKKEGRELDAKKMVVMARDEKVFDFDSPSYKHLVKQLKEDAA